MSVFRRSSSVSLVYVGAAFVVLLAALVAALTFSPSAGAGPNGPDGPDTFTVAVTNSGTGAGIVRSEPSGISCPSGACIFDFALGEPVTLVVESSRGSRFEGWNGDRDLNGRKGWDGSVKGRRHELVVNSPSSGRPVDVEATFDKAAPPAVMLLGKSLTGKPVPRKLSLSLDCRADVPCGLRVTTLLGIWLSKKGYDYYKASSAIYGSPNSAPNGGTPSWKASTETEHMSALYKAKARKASAGKPVAIRIVVQDVETGRVIVTTRKGINENGLKKGIKEGGLK